MKKILMGMLVLSIIVGATLVGCNKTAATIKIGVAGPHTGDLAPYGIPTLEATQILASRINEAGGINGAQVEIIPADDVCDPAQATTVASKLVADGVLAVIGHVCSGATISAMATYMSSGIPVVSPSATNPSLTKGDYKGFYRTIAPDDKQGVLQGTFLAERIGAKKVAVVHDQQDYGKGLADSAKASLEARGIVVPVYEGISVGAVDYSAVVSKIIGAGVDAVVYGGYTPEGSKLFTQLKAKSYKGAIITGDGFRGEDFVNLAGAAANDVYVTGPKDYTSGNKYKEALAEYKQAKSSDPGTFYFEGYAALTTVLAAVEAGNVTSADVANYLSSNSFDTVIGTISFDKNGDAIGTGFDVYQVRNGEFVVAN